MNTNTEQKVHELMASPTLQNLLNLSQSVPVKNKKELKIAVNTCLISLVDALDNNRIHFNDIEDQAILHGLLTLGLLVIYDGKVPVEKVTMQ